MANAPKVDAALKATFGTSFTDKIAITHYRNGAWEPFTIQPYGPIQLEPSAHVLHYASTCFEGLKAHRHDDGSVHIFRLDRHMQRLHDSAGLLCLPQPDPRFVSEGIKNLIRECVDWVPEQPGALYIRPTLFGTLASIGAAASPSSEACLYILLSPVGDYFETGLKPLKILIDDDRMRTAPHFGSAKTGGNYASALGQIQRAKQKYGVQQVLFAPDGDVQETGAANFLLISDHEILTKKLDNSFLHGVTRDSILELGRDLGYKISEREIGVTEVLEWARYGEAALSGTAAVLAGIGSFVYNDEVILCNNGEIGPNTLKLRQALIDIHGGKSPDNHHWLTRAC
ncbi:MAG: branched-chain amino acid aminotransferase [Acidobacteriota bacterium]|nr:branched-chain amino acid aminotransferase [Acidobacteriota bacterium]